MWTFPENYKQPEAVSNYLKFKKDWDTEFRILSDSIIGWVYFNLENKPVRTKEFPDDWKLQAKVNEKSNKQDSPKHFRAFQVRDYANNRICILEITQKSIQNDIMAYYKNTKRGDPKEYDLTVTRVGEWLETKYTVIANPKTPLTEAQSIAYFDSVIKLDALYEGKDPFTS